MHRTEIINDLIKDHGFKRYLEIGLGDGKNFMDIKNVYKIGVDPAVITQVFMGGTVFKLESDTFFKKYTGKPFDLIFIDGLHHSNQVEKDIVNAWGMLSDGGVILLHDCIPWEETISRVPRQTVTWTGDVYRAVCGFYENYGDKVKMKYYPERTGIITIHKTENITIALGFNKPDLSYQDFVGNWKDILTSL